MEEKKNAVTNCKSGNDEVRRLRRTAGQQTTGNGVYSGNKSSEWIFRIEDLRAYKNVDELVEKLALPSRPSKIAIVEVPEGTVLRKSIVGEQEWGTKPQGGAVQYEIIGTYENNWFKPLYDEMWRINKQFIDNTTKR